MVVNGTGEILLIYSSGNDNWRYWRCHRLGEFLAQAATRETMEETSICCEVTGLAGTYTPGTSSNTSATVKSARSSPSSSLHARSGDAATTSSESPEVVGVPAAETGQLPMQPTMRERIGHYHEWHRVPYTA